MFKWIVVLVLVFGLTIACDWCDNPVAADALLAEIGDAGTTVAQGIELSLLGGTVGWGAGAFWPLHEVEQLGGVTVGPFIAFGNQLIAAGVGAKFGIEIPWLENIIDFVAVGGAFKHDSLTGEIWVGKVWK